MKTLIKTITLCAICLFGYGNAQAAPAQKDSIIITFGDKTRMIIYGNDRKELEKLTKYDLNALLKDLGARLDTINGETKIYFEDLDGTKYLKDKKDGDKNYVRIDLRGIYIKDGEREVTITTRGVDVKDGDEDDDRRRNRSGVDTTATDGNSSRNRDRDYDNDDDNDRIVRIHRVRRYRSPRQGFIIALGLNAYANNNPGATYNTEEYDLRPFGSRYISLGYVKSATIVRGKSTGFHVDFGLDVAWNNLMFEGNNTVEKTASDVQFPLVRNSDNREVDLRKSKLTVPYANFSVMPTVSFSNAFITYLSAGGYVGYRLGGYTKIKMPNGKKDHVRSDYYLNDFRYGAAVELGVRNFLDLFVHYDINPLFQDNQGPNVRMINFGLRF